MRAAQTVTLADLKGQIKSTFEQSCRDG